MLSWSPYVCPPTAPPQHYVHKSRPQYPSSGLKVPEIADRRVPRQQELEADGLDEEDEDSEYRPDDNEESDVSMEDYSDGELEQPQEKRRKR